MKPKKNRSNVRLNNEVMKNRILITIVGLLTIVSIFMLISIWFNLSPYSILPSSTKVIYAENASTIYVPTEYSKTWDSRYKSDTSEFIYCLYGREFENGYLVTDMGETEVVYADSEAISYVSCNKKSGYLGTIHSHPQPDRVGYVATCGLSTQDVYTFGADQATVTGVICGTKKYGFYAPGEFERSMSIAIVEFES